LADVERFRWTTGAPGFAETEEELLETLRLRVSEPCLEIGCGEGNNLLRLSRSAQCVGIDRSVPKLVFAAKELPAVRFIAADGAALPFRDGAFKTVFIRDLLHHVESPSVVVDEALRVLAIGGHLLVLEPNGRNPIIRLQGLLVSAEAGARTSGRASLAALFDGKGLDHVEIQLAQPLPLRRMILHYRFGLPVLGRVRVVRQALALVERLAGKLLPPSRWACVVVTVEYRGGGRRP
jgi:ubiquinone/menaquinone biosynthesis C-methylase UbiE